MTPRLSRRQAIDFRHKLDALSDALHALAWSQGRIKPSGYYAAAGRDPHFSADYLNDSHFDLGRGREHAPAGR